MLRKHGPVQGPKMHWIIGKGNICNTGVMLQRNSALWLYYADISFQSAISVEDDKKKIYWSKEVWMWINNLLFWEFYHISVGAKVPDTSHQVCCLTWKDQTWQHRLPLQKRKFVCLWIRFFSAITYSWSIIPSGTVCVAPGSEGLFHVLISCVQTQTVSDSRTEQEIRKAPWKIPSLLFIRC